VKRASFPIRYLGLPLSTTRLKNVDFQPVVDKMTGKLNAWNGRNVTMSRRLTLVKSVLTSQVIHLLSALRVPKGILKLIDNKRKQFLWAGNEVLTGGKCKVNWIRAARSKKGGGLGILHLGKFSRALRLRWLWKLCKKENGQWLDSETPCTTKGKQLFVASTTITVGNGDNISFWENAWLQGRRPRDIAPTVHNISRRKNRSLRAALLNNNLVRDLDLLNAHFSAAHFREYCELWHQVTQTRLHHDTPDNITWKLTADGTFKTKSAYEAQFIGSSATSFVDFIWKIWAPPKCKMFSWLAIQNRIWTADRLAARGWPHNNSCVLCRATQETGIHLFAECRFVKRIWDAIGTWARIEGLSPATGQPFQSVEDWRTMLARLPSNEAKSLRSLIMLVIWKI